MGKVVGNQVYIPGSPSMTLPELLDRTEASLHKEELSAHFSPLRNVSFADDFSTPTKQIIPSFDRFKASPARPVGPRAWSKSDWKQLDACYTDERLALGELLGLGADELASADVVELEDVVERFVKILGGDEVLEQFGSQWTRCVYQPYNVNRRMSHISIIVMNYSSVREHCKESNALAIMQLLHQAVNHPSFPSIPTLDDISHLRHAFLPFRRMQQPVIEDLLIVHLYLLLLLPDMTSLLMRL